MSAPRTPSARRLVVALGALTLWSALALPTEARASRQTDIVDGFARTGEHSVDGTVELRYDFKLSQSIIQREFRCLAHDTLPGGGAVLCPDGSRIIDVDELSAVRTQHVLTLDARIGFWRYAEVAFELPIVLLDQTELSFVDGVDAQNSTVAPYNQAQLFSVPHVGPRRAGVGDPILRARFAPLSLARDATRPSWTLDLALTIPVSAMGGEVRAAGNEGVSEGLWIFGLGTGMAARPVDWVEPWFHLGTSIRVPDASSLFEEYGPTQGSIGPGHSIHMRLGTDFIPFEDRDDEELLVVDVGIGLAYQFEGRDYTPLFNALGTSPCDPRDPQSLCDLTTFDRGTLDPTTGQKLKTNGLTDVESHATVSGWVGLRWQPIKYLQVGANVRLEYELPHFLTFADAGEDLDFDGVIEQGSGLPEDPTNEYSPVFNGAYDSLGTRFRSGGLFGVGVQLSVQAKF